MKCNSKGKIIDPLAGKYLAIDSSEAQTLLASIEANGDLSNFENSFEVAGGSLYSPLIKKDETYYTLADTDGSIRDANAFGMDLDGSTEQFDFTFTHYENMPLLA